MQLFSFGRPRISPLAELQSAAFANSLDDAPDPVLALTSDGRIARMNRQALKLLGRAAIGQSLCSFVKRDERQRFDESLAAARRGATERFDVSIKDSAGAARIVAVAVGAVRGGVADGWLVSARDVTVERESREQLVTSESRYRQLFEAASDAILTIDYLGRFTTVNGAAERISGYTHAELIGKFFGPLLAMEAMPRALLEFRRALSGAAGQFETIMLHKSGERRHLTVNYACPQKGREVICMIRDATAEKQLHEQLIQAEKMGAIGQLVSGVAHELNNPLASISAFAQLLLADRQLTDDQRHSADVIRAEGTRASRIVNNLLTFARQHRTEKTAADLNSVLHDTLELRRYELNVRGIQIRCDFEEPPPVTMVDVHQIQQVVLNLITNAEQAMESIQRPRHQLLLRTRNLGECIRIEVEDTGCGIPAHALNQIFNPFFTTKPLGKGTGLGLSISLGIMSEHGGRIWAENLAQGTRFTVELPCIACERPNLTIVSAPQPTRSAALRILVADDEEPLRAALERFLTSEGHSVVTVGSGSEAIWRAEGEEIFDIVLLDLRMPDVSGQQVFERWQTEHRELSERVVFITGDIMSAELQAFLRRTERPYIAKPFEFSAIVDVLPTKRVA